MSDGTLEPETIKMLHENPGEASLFTTLVYDSLMKFAKAGGTQEELESLDEVPVD